jgi:hypothetical protein
LKKDCFTIFFPFVINLFALITFAKISKSMKVFKFGGASVKDADAVRNVGHIIAQYTGEKLLVIISAMGKNTNKLEEQMKELFLTYLLLPSCGTIQFT